VSSFFVDASEPSAITNIKRAFLSEIQVMMFMRDLITYKHK
jgi:hypothetical protein